MQTVANPQLGVFIAPQSSHIEEQSKPGHKRLLAGLVTLVLVFFSSVGGSYVWNAQLSYASAQNPSVIEARPVVASESLNKIAQSIALLEKEEQQAAEIRAAQAKAAKPKAPAIAALPAANSLQAVVDRWKAAHSEISTSVYVQEINGDGRSASSAAGTVMFSASLYKLYVAHYLYNRIEQGTLAASDKLGSDLTVAACIEAMIVVSNNDCPHAVADTVGWTALHNFARSQGFSGTNLLNGNIQTTAADSAKFMQRLNNGELMNGEHTNQLLGFMKRQIYRAAIPAGASGSAVADKVGFYGGYWHDAGIVYGPKSTYVISVMTKGGSAKTIADLAKQIHQFLQ